MQKLKNEISWLQSKSIENMEYPTQLGSPPPGPALAALDALVAAEDPLAVDSSDDEAALAAQDVDALFADQKSFDLGALCDEEAPGDFYSRYGEPHDDEDHDEDGEAPTDLLLLHPTELEGMIEAGCAPGGAQVAGEARSFLCKLKT